VTEDDVADRLRMVRLRASGARVTVLRELATRTSATCTQIVDATECEAVATQTVYRTMWTAERAGIVERIPNGRARWRWRWKHSAY